MIAFLVLLVAKSHQHPSTQAPPCLHKYTPSVPLTVPTTAHLCLIPYVHSPFNPDSNPTRPLYNLLQNEN